MKRVLDCIVGLVFFGFLQCGTAFGQGNTGNDPDFPDVPLDGGMSLLLGAGAVYALKRYKDIKGKENI